MKYMKRAGVYQSSNYNCTFDPSSMRAVSYKWWTFVAKVEGQIVFNNYRYSVTTSKHQAKVRSLLSALGIKIDLELPLPKGIMPLASLDEMILAAEEHLFEKEFESQLKRQERNLIAKFRRDFKRLESYLENVAHFRDYEIKQLRQFGHVNEVAVHQVVGMKSIGDDVNHALESFGHDGFSKVVFYV